ncbi:Uncharacterised protein [uncultured archaeon]|nr:Uncharacterised protein [uncultured archaeon]
MFGIAKIKLNNIKYLLIMQSITERLQKIKGRIVSGPHNEKPVFGVYELIITKLTETKPQIKADERRLVVWFSACVFGVNLANHPIY